jgi:hypothetical protein
VPTAAAAPTAAASAHVAQLQGVKLLNVSHHHPCPFPPSGAVLTLVEHSYMNPRVLQPALHLLGLKGIAAVRVLKDPGRPVLVQHPDNLEGRAQRQVTLDYSSLLLVRHFNVGAAPGLRRAPQRLTSIPCRTERRTRRPQHAAQDLVALDFLPHTALGSRRGQVVLLPICDVPAPRGRILSPSRSCHAAAASEEV